MNVFRWMVCLCFCCMHLQAQRVLLLTSNHTPGAEVDSLAAIWQDNGYQVLRGSVASLRPSAFRGVDMVCYHRSDSAAFGKEEVQARSLLLPYVEKGGKLLLTMEAVRLLNEWQVEPSEIEVAHQDAIDEGFGRAVGFHAYRAHPLFEGLHGGAYVWKSVYDHQARTWGFSKGTLPAAPGAKVLGINWAYIRYDEDRKLVWETPWGKGKIMAVGGYLYFSQKNLNRATLHLFMRNVADYLTENRAFRSVAKWWPYDSVRIEKVDFPVLQADIPHKLFADDRTHAVEGHSRPGSRTHYWNVSGERLVAMGREQGGLEEIWIHPVMVLRDWTVRVEYQGNELMLDTLPVQVIQAPGCMERRYALPGGDILSERLAVSRHTPLLSVGYTWTDSLVRKVHIRFSTNLRLMWPYSAESTGRIQYAISQDKHMVMAFDRSRELNMITAFAQDPLSVDACEEEKAGRLSFHYSFSGMEKQIDFRLSGGDEGTEKALAHLHGAIGSTPLVQPDYLSIESSDPLFNEAYRWGVVAVDQLYAHTPAVGSSLMAGYWTTGRGWNGGHAVSGRPGYAWYFGRDAVFCALAMNAYGASDKVKEVLRTFARFQSLDGKIYHELTTSGSVHYDAADATPLYVILAGNYLRRMGDVEFIRALWPSLQRAMDFCYSTDTDGDGLIENTNVGHGWQEGYELYGAHTEVYLAAVWAQALKEAGYLSSVLGEQSLAPRYAEDYHRVVQWINGPCWNDSLQCFNHGVLRDGTFQQQACVLCGTPVMFGLADSRKALQTALLFPSRYFSTDWGVRMVGYRSPYYGIGGYRYGNVWPFHTGCAALAEYRAGLLSQGFRHAYGSLRLYDYWDYGHVAEVIQGDRFSFTGICPHQGWSSATNLWALYEGMLGMEADALAQRLTLSPAFPADWSHADVKPIRVGCAQVRLHYARQADSYLYRMVRSGNVDVRFSVRLPLCTTIVGVEVNGTPVPYTVEQEVACVRVTPTAGMPLHGDTLEVVVRTRGGVAVMQNLPRLHEGMPDEGLKIEQELYCPDRQTYRVQLAGVPAKSYEVSLFVRSEVLAVEGGVLTRKEGDVHTYTVTMKEAKDEPFVGHTLKLWLR